MTPRYFVVQEVFGYKIGEVLEEHPVNAGFFRRYGTDTEYTYMSPYDVMPEISGTHSLVDTDAQKHKGIKDDSGKTQWWYMDNFWPDLEQVADVLTYGDSKYPAEDGANWKRLDNPEQRLCDALLRHVLKYRYESKEDSETGKSHLAHAITNALMLMYFDRNKKGN